MPTAIIYLNEELNDEIIKLSKELKVSKHDVIIKLLADSLKTKRR